MTDVEKPEISANEVLIKITKTAICGTDLHIYQWDSWSAKTLELPVTIGHEFVGRIEKIGHEVKGFNLNDRVSGEGHITCEYCRNCRAGKRHLCRNSVGIGIQKNGAFAEYLAIPASNIFKVDDSISDKIAAIFDPLGNAVHSALSFDLVGEDVLVTGAGPIGIMSAIIAKHVGARHVIITDINDYRLNLAKEIKGLHVLHGEKGSLRDIMKSLNIVEGFDVGLEMSGSPNAFSTMLNFMNNGGKIANLGIFSNEVKIDMNQMIFKGLSFKGIYGREMFETWYKMFSLLRGGLDVEKIITHEFPFYEYEKGFSLMEKGLSAKVVLDWSV